MPYIAENIIKEIKYANCYVADDNHTKIELFFDKKIKSAYFFGEEKTTIKEIGRFTLVSVTMQQKRPGVIVAAANIDFDTGCLQHFDFKIKRSKWYVNGSTLDQINDFSIFLSSDFRGINRDVFQK